MGASICCFINEKASRLFFVRGGVRSVCPNQNVHTTNGTSDAKSIETSVATSAATSVLVPQGSSTGRVSIIANNRQDMQIAMTSTMVRVVAISFIDDNIHLV